MSALEATIEEKEQPRVFPDERRAQLILEHLPRVHWIASKIHQKLPPGVCLEDLVSAGVLGLIEAVDHYDPRYNVKLQTYADHRIRGAILDSISGLDGIPAHKRIKAKQLEQAAANAAQRTNGSSSSEDVARELGISLDEYHAQLQETRQVRIRSLEAVCIKGKEEFSLLDVLADDAERQPYYQIEKEELRKLVHKGLASLPPMERIVMTLYFNEGWRLREIAGVVDLHITRISQLKAQATLRLRCFIMARWPTGKGGALGRTNPVMRAQPIPIH
jgi:RNA polymerase sigma factor for flagellar operon FliA